MALTLLAGVRDRRAGGTDPLQRPHSTPRFVRGDQPWCGPHCGELLLPDPALSYLGNNVVLAAWDGRPGSSADAPNPNSIVQRRSTDGGQTWGPVQVIAAGHVADASGPKYGYSDPSYIYDAEAGKVFALFVHSKDQGFGGSDFGNDDADRNVISSAVIESSDGGVTWSQPRLITNITKPGTSKTSPVATQPHAAGDAFPYTFSVSNTSPLVEKVVPTTGNFSPFVPEGSGNCRYSVLPAGQGFTCATPRHTVTAERPHRASSSRGPPGKSAPRARAAGATRSTAAKWT